MTIERKTVLEQSEIHRSGNLGVKIAKLLVEDGVEVDCQWHRTSIPIDVDPAQHMAAVNAHFATMEPPMPAVSPVDIEFVIACHNLLKQRMELV